MLRMKNADTRDRGTSLNGTLNIIVLSMMRKASLRSLIQPRMTTLGCAVHVSFSKSLGAVVSYTTRNSELIHNTLLMPIMSLYNLAFYKHTSIKDIDVIYEYPYINPDKLGYTDTCIAAYKATHWHQAHKLTTN